MRTFKIGSFDLFFDYVALENAALCEAARAPGEAELMPRGAVASFRSPTRETGATDLEFSVRSCCFAVTKCLNSSAASIGEGGRISAGMSLRPS